MMVDGFYYVIGKDGVIDTDTEYRVRKGLELINITNMNTGYEDYVTTDYFARYFINVHDVKEE